MYRGTTRSNVLLVATLRVAALTAAASHLACAARGRGAPETQSRPLVQPDPAHNLLKTTDFSDGVMLPWMTSFTPPAKGSARIENAEMCLSIEVPGANRWDAQLRHREMVLREGHTYRLGFKVRSSRNTKMAVKVGMSGPPYTDYWTEAFSLTPEQQAIAVEFPMTEPDDATVELAFHAGGSMVTNKEPVELCFDDVVLSDPTFTPPPEEKPEPVPLVRVNQLGYFPKLEKLAVLVARETEPQDWRLVSPTGEALSTGQTQPHGLDATSGDFVHLIDFSDFEQQGTNLKVVVGEHQSDPFEIASALYQDLTRDALRFFYHMRSGTPIEMPYAEQKKWTHPAGHVPDVADCAPDIDCDYSLDVTGGWYDAGDQGKYVVNGGFSVWTLMNAHERALLLKRDVALLSDDALNIPESGNGIPDILDEARWEMEFLLKMQIPGGKPLAGMAHHKMHDVQWTALGTAPHEDEQQRILRPPSTAATLNLAAVGAQAARLFRAHDEAYATRCLEAAEKAWSAAQVNPNHFAPPTDVTGGGPYADTAVEDEFYWAAAELYLTTGKPEYLDHLQQNTRDGEIGTDLVIDGQASASGVTWRRVDVLGKMSLALRARPSYVKGSSTASHLPQEQAAKYREQLRQAAELLISTLRRQGYRFPMRPGPKGNYPWGSNGEVLGNVMLLGAAADWTEGDRYTQGVVAGLDYLLGRNAMGQSYVSGYGERPFRNPHHRFFAHQANAEYPPPPPGFVAGGPNSDMQDPYVVAAGLENCPQQKCYVDHIEAYSVNEVAINWNAAMAWATTWLDQRARAGDSSGIVR